MFGACISDEAPILEQAQSFVGANPQVMSLVMADGKDIVSRQAIFGCIGPECACSDAGQAAAISPYPERSIVLFKKTGNRILFQAGSISLIKDCKLDSIEPDQSFLGAEP